MKLTSHMNNWSISFRENAHKTHISGKLGYESLIKNWQNPMSKHWRNLVVPRCEISGMIIYHVSKNGTTQHIMAVSKNGTTLIGKLWCSLIFKKPWKFRLSPEFFKASKKPAVDGDFALGATTWVQPSVSYPRFSHSLMVSSRYVDGVHPRISND